jgi:hypothetical protein
MKTLAVVCPALVFSIALGYPSLLLRASPPGNSKLSIQVVIEVQKGEKWERVDAQTVFHIGDAVRFRFRASQGGYLYVLNRSSDKTTSWLFPRAGSGERSQIDQHVEYLIPTGQGSFEVGGSPGFDVTYWILSPHPIDATPSIVPAEGDETNTIEPRCRAEVLKARGLCTDDRAGPHAVDNPVELPLQPPETEKLHSRDLKFKTEEGATEISGLTKLSDVVVYEFTIAHK